MARKMTPAQVETLTRLNAGWPLEFIVAGEPPALASGLHKIMSRHDCMDGKEVCCHRTIKTDTPAGSQTQSFRIAVDGSIERKL